MSDFLVFNQSRYSDEGDLICLRKSKIEMVKKHGKYTAIYLNGHSSPSFVDNSFESVIKSLD